AGPSPSASSSAATKGSRPGTATANSSRMTCSLARLRGGSQGAFDGRAIADHSRRAVQLLKVLHHPHVAAASVGEPARDLAVLLAGHVEVVAMLEEILARPLVPHHLEAARQGRVGRARPPGTLV